MTKKKIKEDPVQFKPFVVEPEQEKEPVPIPPNTDIKRSELNLQRFMNDMQLIGDQVRSNKIKKPAFHYGDLAVTNYLLWLILAELQIQNTKSEIGI